jgi:putative ABC transport system permease protein
VRWPFRRRSREQDLEDEILAHLAMEAQHRIDRGESPTDAERAARRDFGSVALAQEVTRTMWTGNQAASIARELRFAVRSLRKTPAFTAVAVLTLALGIGANTAIFTLVDDALLRPLPFPHSDRLVRILSTKMGAPTGGPSPMDLRDFARDARSFDGMVVYDHWRKNVGGISGADEPREMVVGLVPRAYFELLGIRPILGRLFTSQEDEYGKHYVAIVSDAFWRNRFASDPDVLRRTLRINGETYSIVGVVPDIIPGWMDGASASVSLWTPFAFPEAWTEATRGQRDFSSIARLKPGVPYEQGRAELAALASRLAQEHPVDRGVGATLEPLADTRAGPVRPVLLMLSGAVGMVLLIACANLASLLLARNSARYREMAVRAALGASRWQLLRQLLLETLVLSSAGGVVGLGLVCGAGIFFSRANPSGAMPYIASFNVMAPFWSATPDARVLLFTFAASIATAILFGLAPAFSGTRVSLADSLREAGRNGTTGAARLRFRNLLVVAEVALSMILIVAAALLTQTMVRLARRDPGFPADHLLLAHVYVPPVRYPDAEAITAFCDRFGERLRAMPGVRDASITTGFPPLIGWHQMFTVPGRPASRAEDVPTTRFAAVDARYLGTLGLALVTGRGLSESDTSAAAPVIVVNEEFVRRYFPGQNPIGRQIHPGPPPGVTAPAFGDFGHSTRDITVVGVVRDFLNRGLSLPPGPQAFALFRQFPGVNFGFKDVAVRTAADPESLLPAVARELRALDPDMALGEVRTMETHLGSQTADTRFITVLLGLFAALGTLLAVIGAYGVIAYFVAQRTHELGVRVALGASSRDILYLVLRNGIAMGLAGVLLGVIGAIVVRQSLSRLLYGVSASDPFTIGGAAVLLLSAIVAASAIPARRVLRIDPLQALRSE